MQGVADGDRIATCYVWTDGRVVDLPLSTDLVSSSGLGHGWLVA